MFNYKYKKRESDKLKVNGYNKIEFYTKIWKKCNTSVSMGRMIIDHNIINRSSTSLMQLVSPRMSK